MATSGFPTLDPLNLWRDALSKWEGGTNQLANQQMGSEDFARAMNGLLGMSLGLQQALGKANAALLKELNLPSRSELVELGERLQRIEEQLALLTRLLGGAAADAPAAPMPPRTRRPGPGAVPAVPVPAAPAVPVASGRLRQPPAGPAAAPSRGKAAPVKRGRSARKGA